MSCDVRFMQVDDRSQSTCCGSILWYLKAMSISA